MDDNLKRKISDNAMLGLKKVYVLYEISSAMIVSIDTNKNFFAIMNILKSRLETSKGALITFDAGNRKKDEILFGFDEVDIKSGSYDISDDVIRNVFYTKDIVFLVHSGSGIEAKGTQMMNFIAKDTVHLICVPIIDDKERVSAILIVDRLFDNDTQLEKDVFFLRSIAGAIAKNLILKTQVESEREELSSENDRLKQELRSNYKFGNIITTNERVSEVIETVKQVSGSSAPVLISGAYGTGKELIAKALHYNSPRVGNTFTKVHCGAVPEQLLAMELFGYEPEEFNISHPQQKRGKLKAADGGTIYFENIHSMPVTVQVKLLKYLTDGEFEKEGIGKVIKSNTRVIASSVRDFKQLVETGELLEELYNELNIIHITLPALQERKEDISLLSKYFIKRYSKENRKKITDLSPQALDKLLDYDWPGNVRELENCIKRMVIMSGGRILDESLLPCIIKDKKEEKEKSYEGGVEEVIDAILKDKLEKIVTFFGMQKRRKKNSLYKKISDNIDRILIELSLNKFNNVQTDAAAFLGINRNTLRTKIEKLKVNHNQPKQKRTKGKRNLDLPFI